MPNYAISNGQKIINVVVAESQELAQELTGFDAILTDGKLWIDWFLLDGSWVPPQPFPSWQWNGEEWIPPIPLPEDDGILYNWDEASLSWKQA